VPRRLFKASGFCFFLLKQRTRALTFQLALVIAPTDAPEAPPVEAFARFRRLTCDGVDTDLLTAFSNTRQSSVKEPHPEQSD
jgi:hypothetical protein